MTFMLRGAVDPILRYASIVGAVVTVDFVFRS